MMDYPAIILFLGCFMAVVLAECSVNGTTTVSSNGDATGFASCETFSGSVAIATVSADVYWIENIEITGNLVANNAFGLNSLYGRSLEHVGTFELQGLDTLRNIWFPELTKVDRIDWSNLPALAELSLSTGIKEAYSVNIHNTSLGSLDGFDLQTADTFFVANNKFLEDITVPFNNISEAITLSANSYKLQVSFPNLEWAYNITLRNARYISMPSLKTINGSMGFYDGRTSSIELSNLTDIGGSLSFVGNGDLSTIALPALESVNGSFQIADSQKLDAASFPRLHSVGGALDFSGSFSNISLTSLEDVRGPFSILSTEDGIDDMCERFRALSGPGNVIKGGFVCGGGCTDPRDASTCRFPSAQASSSSISDETYSYDENDNETGISVGIGVGVGGVVFLAFMGAIFLLRRRWKRQPQEAMAPETMAPEKVDRRISELPGSEPPDHARHDEVGECQVNEMAVSHVMYELPETQVWELPGSEVRE